MEILVPYYSDNTRISNSNIGWFLNKGPAFLHSMLNGEASGENTPQLALGSMIHEYLLQPEEFHKHYLVWDKSRPSSAQQEKFCRALIATTEIEPNKVVLSAYKEAYSTTGRSDEKMLSEGLKIASTLKDYIDFLKQKDERILISPYQASQLMKISENIWKHKKAKTLLRTPCEVRKAYGEAPFTEEGKLQSVLYHEFQINWEFMDVNCKSLLDSLYLDFENKKCILMDLKTTAKINKFEDSMKDYDYLRQLCFYTKAIEWYLENELNEEPGEWLFEWYIIAIDTISDNSIRVFGFTEDQVYSRLDTIEQALKDIKWHQDNNLWTYRREYYEGDGTEQLSL